MNRAYQIHLERIQAHEEQHIDTSQANDVIQILDPDLSCRICFPERTLHRAFRRFWS